MKCCKKCGNIKPFSDFYKNSKTKDGLLDKCKSCQKSMMTQHRSTEEQREYRASYYLDNRDRNLSQAKVYYTNVRKKTYSTEKYKEYIRGYIRVARAKNPNLNLYAALNGQIRKVLIGVRQKSETVEALVGCSLSMLKSHFESKFKDGMSWDNYGKKGWTIDHIAPCSLFDLTDMEQRKQCYHYTNLQPLWFSDNIRKSDKILEPVQMHLTI